MLYNVKNDKPNEITRVQVAEGAIIQSTSTGSLRFKGILHVEFSAKVFDELEGSLLGVGAIVDGAHVKACLSSDSIEFIDKQGNVVLTGPRCRQTGLWNINLDDAIIDKHPASMSAKNCKALSVRPLPMD
jgi:hypothetical protein